MKGLKERWADFCMAFGLRFLNLWNARKKVFSLLFVLILVFFGWYWFAPSLLSLTLTLITVILTLILGLVGIVVIPKVRRDVTKTVRLVTGTLAVVVPVVVILLSFLAWLVYPLLVYPRPPVELGLEEMDVRAAQVTIHNYSIAGPVEYNGIKTTRVFAERMEVWGLVVRAGEEGEVGIPHAVLENIELYCTYVRATGEALRVSSTTAWTGKDSPPALIALLGDPTTLTNVTVRMVYQSASMLLGDVGISHEKLYIEPENTFIIRANKMAFSCTSNLVELLLGIVKFKNLSAENLEIEIPGNDYKQFIRADLVTTPKGEMKVTTIEVLGMTITHLKDLVPLLLGKTVEWENVKIDAESMYAEDLVSIGLYLEAVYA